MNQKFILAAVFVLVSSFILPLKNALHKIKSKPTAYTLAWCNMSGKASKLEQITALLQRAKGKTTSSTYTIAGTKSFIRIKITEVCFQALPDQNSSQLNPNNYISLYKLSVGKSNRSFTVNNDGSSNPMLMPIAIEVITEGYTYKIILGTGLLQGEYAFIDKTTIAADGSVKVWAFGID